MTLQEIGDRYGISRQRVQQRFRYFGLPDAPETHLIDKPAEREYAGERLFIAKIGEAFRLNAPSTIAALEFHKILNRRSVAEFGKYIDRLRELKFMRKNRGLGLRSR